MSEIKTKIRTYNDVIDLFHAVPDGTYDSLAKARSMDRFSGSKRLEGDDK